MPELSATEFQRTTDDAWRVIDGSAVAWFDAPSHRGGAALVERIAGFTPGSDLPDIDLRSVGVRVGLGGPDEAKARRAAMISEAAEALGLTPEPSVLQVMALAVDSPEPEALVPFWRTLMGYRAADNGRLLDPLARDPAIVFVPDDDVRPLRNRLHIDVGRPAESVAATLAELRQTPTGPYGLMLSDDAGNEVDLVPGGPMAEDAEISDWVAPFAAMAFYPTSTPQQAVELVAQAAALADEADIRLLIDLRPDGVMLDSGKDLWESADGPVPAFVELAAEIQAAARQLGLSADRTRLRFVQYCLDIADLTAERGFWTSVLGYEPDTREGIVDIFDPRRLNPVLIFQRIDVSDGARLRQRDRMRIRLSVPGDQVEPRVTDALAAGGRIVGSEPGRTRLSDPEGNELELLSEP